MRRLKVEKQTIIYTSLLTLICTVTVSLIGAVRITSECRHLFSKSAYRHDGIPDHSCDRTHRSLRLGKSNEAQIQELISRIFTSLLNLLSDKYSLPIPSFRAASIAESIPMPPSSVSIFPEVSLRCVMNTDTLTS